MSVGHGRSARLACNLNRVVVLGRRNARATSHSEERSRDKSAKRRRAVGGKRASPHDERKKPNAGERARARERVGVAGKYGWLAIHLFMGHLSGVAMATPVVSGAIVKLSNEKIRKYHLARAPRPAAAASTDPPAFTRPLSFSPVRAAAAAALFPSSLSFSRCRARFLDDGWNKRAGAFGRLPAVTGDGTRW